MNRENKLILMTRSRPVKPARNGILIALLLTAGCSRAEPGMTPDAFRSSVAALAEQAEGLTVPGLDGWLFQANELRFVGHDRFWGPEAVSVSRASNPSTADPVPAIVGFHEGLKAKGVELVMVPVPAKTLVFPDKIVEGAPVSRLDDSVQGFYEVLRTKGVNVLDLTETFLADRDGGERGPIYCRTDTHWAPRGCEVAAASIAKLIRDQGWLPEAGLAAGSLETSTRDIAGDLVEGRGDPDAGRESLSIRPVGEATLESDPAGPVILMGDSHTLVFSDGLLHGDRAGLADHLARELGASLDLSFRNKGSGATVVRTNLLRKQLQSSRAGSDYLGGKKVVVWCFAAREFSESTAGWRVLPVSK